MNKRFIGVLIFAFIVASLGGLVTYRQLVNHAPAPSASAPMAKIVLASRNIEAGAILGKDDVQLADWGGPIPTGASAKPEDFIGRGVLSEIYSKEPVSESRLAAKGSGGGLASLIPEGMRAFAVRVNDVAGVAGFVTAGMRVDIVINGSPPVSDPSEGVQARTLLQNVEVLSAGQDFKKDAEGKPVTSQVVNLLVTPDQAEKLSLAASGATIQLVLRNPLDRQIAPTQGSDLAALYGGSGPRPPAAALPAAKPAPAPAETRPVVHEAPPQPIAFTMEIISGTQKIEKQFVSEGGKP